MKAKNYSAIMQTNANRMTTEKIEVDIAQETLLILDEVLSLKGRGLRFNAETPLLGALPELDSMAVVALLTTFEERFGIVIHDDEIDAATFATVGTLVAFVRQKLAG